MYGFVNVTLNAFIHKSIDAFVTFEIVHIEPLWSRHIGERQYRNVYRKEMFASRITCICMLFYLETVVVIHDKEIPWIMYFGEKTHVHWISNMLWFLITCMLRLKGNRNYWIFRGYHVRNSQH
jgi:hypothetical protein